MHKVLLAILLVLVGLGTYFMMTDSSEIEEASAHGDVTNKPIAKAITRSAVTTEIPEEKKSDYMAIHAEPSVKDEYVKEDEVEAVSGAISDTAEAEIAKEIEVPSNPVSESITETVITEQVPEKEEVHNEVIHVRPMVKDAYTTEDAQVIVLDSLEAFDMERVKKVSHRKGDVTVIPFKEGSMHTANSIKVPSNLRSIRGLIWVDAGGLYIREGNGKRVLVEAAQ